MSRNKKKSILPGLFYRRPPGGAVVPGLERESKRVRENLFLFEVGHIVVGVDGRSDWTFDATELMDGTHFINTLNPKILKVPDRH